MYIVLRSHDKEHNNQVVILPAKVTQILQRVLEFRWLLCLPSLLFPEVIITVYIQSYVTSG